MSPRIVVGVVASLLVVALVAAVFSPVGVGGAVLLVALSSQEDSGSCQSESGTGVGSMSLDAEQEVNARTIIEVTFRRRLSVPDAVIAIMTALTESTLYNVDHGDEVGPDSIGLFQQRDPWGPLSVRTDPAGATGLFLDSLTDSALKVYRTSDLVNSGPGSRNEVAPWLVAQSVQRSAFADGSNYQRQYVRAIGIVKAVNGVDAEAAAVLSRWSGGAISPDETVTCEDSSDRGGGNGSPGVKEWGGYSNGKIPLSELAPIPWAPGQLLRADATAALTRLNAAYRARFGVDIAITDSYRDYDAQVRLKAAKPFLAAKPGTSNHGWALAVDLGGGINSFGTPQHVWMVANGPAYGWVHPGWAGQSGSKPEPWHHEFGNIS